MKLILRITQHQIIGSDLPFIFHHTQENEPFDVLIAVKKLKKKKKNPTHLTLGLSTPTKMSWCQINREKNEKKNLIKSCVQSRLMSEGVGGGKKTKSTQSLDNKNNIKRCCIYQGFSFLLLASYTAIYLHLIIEKTNYLIELGAKLREWGEGKLSNWKINICQLRESTQTFLSLMTSKASFQALSSASFFIFIVWWNHHDDGEAKQSHGK